MKRTLLLCGLGVVLVANCSLAQDTHGLYAPAPPPNSAFVRLVNMTAASASATLGSKTAVAPKAGISPYVVVPQGKATLKAGGVNSSAQVFAGKFYSAIWNGNRFQLITDVTADDRSKAILALYNLGSAKMLDLRTSDGKLSVISGVKPGQMGSRAVNGITVDLAAFKGSKAVAFFRGVNLERGSAYAIIVTDSGSSFTTSTTTTK